MKISREKRHQGRISGAGRVAQIEGVTRALERGDLKLRVRVLEAERADRRASILQVGRPCIILHIIY